MVAGAGFGKSSLLAQAVDENALAPRGDDCWLGCGPGDDDPWHLAAGLAGALGADLGRVTDRPPDDGGATDVAALAAALVDAVWRRTPRQVCLVVDDVHEVGDGEAAGLLAALVEVLPANGHIVLSGRVEPPVPLARLAAQGRVERLDEADLAFADDDLVAFAALRDVSVDRIDDLGGWPALVELRAAAAGDTVDAFLSEEVLSALGAEARQAVAVVAALGGADQALLEAARGPGVELDDLMAPVPLAAGDDAGWYAVHAVWADRLAEELPPAERREAQRRGGLALAGRDLHRAVELLTAAEADDDLRAVLRRECRAQDLTASVEGLARLHERLPPAVRRAPEGELVAGVAVTSTDLDRACRLLASAASRFAEAGDDDGLLCAVEHLALCAHWREDVDLLTELWRWADRLAAVPEAHGLLAIGQALAADTRGEATRVLEALDTIDAGTLAPYWRTPVAWLRASAELALGYAGNARRNVEVAVGAAGPALRGALSMLLVNSQTHCWRRRGGGRDAGTDADRAEPVRERPQPGPRRDDGCVARGPRGQDRRGRAPPRPRPPVRGAVAPAQPRRLVAGQRGLHRARPRRRGRGGPHVPAAARRPPGRRGPPELREHPAHRRCSTCCCPTPATGSRPTASGPCYQPGLALARALVSFREHGDVAAATELTPTAWAAAPAFLPTAWTVELSTAAAAGGRSDAQARVIDCGGVARPTLRLLADDGEAPRAVRTWARTLADALPPEPTAPLDLAVLGPTTLRRDGRAVDHPHWRRERVRALLLVLLARGGGTREELAGALWPDLDTPAALRNLRVTLSYLLAVLEPDRPDGAPSFFVRAEGPSLRLVTDGWLGVDSRAFDALVDRAVEAESHGEPSAALDLYRRAMRLYRGPYLTDAGYEEWALPHRDRLAARFVAAAVRAGELTLAGGDPDEALRLAGRAVEAEPWSEGAHRLSVAAHLARGDRAAARRAMQTCLRQLDDLGVPPTEDTEIVLRAVS